MTKFTKTQLAFAEEALDLLLSTIRNYRAGGLTELWFEPKLGLCYNIEAAISTVVSEDGCSPFGETDPLRIDSLLDRWIYAGGGVITLWPHWTGSMVYPVPAPSDWLGGNGCAYNSLPKYTGEYGDTRLSLLQHLITCIKSRTGIEVLHDSNEQ